MRLPTRKSEIERRLLQQDDRYYTKAAIERMKRERERLLKERPSAAEEVARTAAMGDLSENAAYTAAKFHLRRLNDRITTIEERLKFAIEIPEGSDASGKIRIGSTVTVEIGGKQMTFDILGSHETNPSRGRISYLSPIGAALMDHASGDIVKVKIADREVVYRVIEVR